MLILVQLVDDAGVAPVNVTDERLASLRKRLETDSKGLVLLRARDLTRNSSVLAKLESAVRNYALEYYKAQAKRVKRYKKALNKTPAHQPLHVRHSFKIAHYYEFRRYTTKVLQHYEAAYRALLALPLVPETPNSSNTVISATQVKTMAEYVNFKLCYHLLFSSGNIKAAVEQLHRHMRVFSRAIGSHDRAYEHWDWVARQYHVFAQLLSEAVSIRGALPSTGLDADVYKEPHLYYSIAAKYATYRRKASLRLGLTAASSQQQTEPALTERDFVVVPPVFVGGDPIVSAATSEDQPSTAALVQYCHALERAVPHGKRTIQLLEHAIQHLSIYTADHKSPRARMKSRLLVQLGTERLAAGDLERARAELQKAKLAFSTEHWWPQTTQILQQLLQCTFLQGDTAAFIDYALQLLSPVVEEFVPVAERVRIHDVFVLAWRDPVALSPAFAHAPALGDLHYLALDRTRPLFTLRAQFDRICACVREAAVLALHLHSHFPSPITMAKLELVFSDERYNTVVYDRSGVDDIVQDPADGQYYASLTFHHKVEKVLTLPLRVLEGRSMLRYQETRFYFSNRSVPTAPDGDDVGPDRPEECLVLSLPIEQAAPAVRENPKPYLLDGRVPAMGNGSASPSFARRKSMFSVAELSRSTASDPSLHVSMNNNNSSTDEPLEDDVSVAVRGSTLAILQPRAKAKLALAAPASLLTGDFRVLTFTLAANDDTLESVSVRIVCDPPPASASPSDAFFFTQPAVGGPLVPVPLDATLQPRDRTALPSKAPHSTEAFRVIVRSMRAVASVKLSVSIAYATKSGVHVSLDERFELVCRDPFGITSALVHDYPNGVGAAHAKEQVAVVGKRVHLHGSVVCSAAESLRVVSMAFEPLPASRDSVDCAVTSGFATPSELVAHDPTDTDAVVQDGDSRSFYVRLVPRRAAPFASIGRVRVQWRRLSSQITSAPDDHHANSIVTTWLFVPPMMFIDAPLTLSIDTPPFGVAGAVVPMDIRIRNNENAFHSLRIKPIDDANEFLITGASARSVLRVCVLIDDSVTDVCVGRLVRMQDARMRSKTSCRSRSTCSGSACSRPRPVRGSVNRSDG